MLRNLTVAALLLGLTTLTWGCGQKGPLFLSSDELPAPAVQDPSALEDPSTMELPNDAIEDT